MKNIRGMSLQLLRLLMLAGTCSVILLVCVYFCSDMLIGKYFPRSGLQAYMVQKRLESFSNYIEEHDLAVTDTADLMSWCDKQPMVLMEIYRGNLLYFNSNYLYSDPLSEQNIEANRYKWHFYYEVQFSDGPADILMYSDESYILRSWSALAAVTLAGALFIVIVLIGIRQTVRYIYLLCDEIQIMGSGNLDHPVTIRGHNELGLLATNLDQMRSALLYHRQKEQEMIRQNYDMITGLSHDLRTPLTKLLLYAEIIQHGKYENKQQLLMYLQKINEKCSQMEEITNHLMRYSLSQSSPNMPSTRIVSFQDAFFDRLSEMASYLSLRGFTIDCSIDWSRQLICINEFYLERILDNIISNLEKYADKAFPVEIRFIRNDRCAGIAVKNVQSAHYDASQSSGVGIENVRTMMQQMNGSCTVSRIKNVFEITVLFPGQ